MKDLPIKTILEDRADILDEMYKLHPKRDFVEFAARMEMVQNITKHLRENNVIPIDIHLKVKELKSKL